MQWPAPAVRQQWGRTRLLVVDQLHATTAPPKHLKRANADGSRHTAQAAPLQRSLSLASTHSRAQECRGTRPSNTARQRAQLTHPHTATRYPGARTHARAHTPSAAVPHPRREFTLTAASSVSPPCRCSLRHPRWFGTPAATTQASAVCVCVCVCVDALGSREWRVRPGRGMGGGQLAPECAVQSHCCLPLSRSHLVELCVLCCCAL
jgi:hypothetical protein